MLNCSYYHKKPPHLGRLEQALRYALGKLNLVALAHCVGVTIAISHDI